MEKLKTFIGDHLYLLIAFMSIYIVWLALLRNAYAAGALAGIMSVYMERAYLHRVRSLAGRVEEQDDTPWDVEVNQVKSGSISDADYAGIQLRVLRDARVYVVQALNFGKVALNLFEYCFRAIPLTLFWVAVLLAVFSPDTIASLIAALKAADAGAISKGVSHIGVWLTTLMVMAVAVQWPFVHSRFGYVNHFERAVGVAVRKHCRIAADGQIVLSRLKFERPSGAESPVGVSSASGDAANA